tara:strand:+ start:4430 stop:6226 length:1797 start_codon:yes stop_codon:yes gene_type:complete
MANSYYTRQGSYTKGTLARGDVVKSDYDALVTAWDLGETNIKRALKLPNEGSPQTDWQITENATNRAGKAIGFDTSGNLELQTGVGDWKGTWATGYAYSLRDVVVDGAAGASTDNLYICIVAHTSGTWSTDLSAAKWELMVNVSEARDWARKTDGIVDSTDYSSKAWAIGGTDVSDTASRGAAKEWAIETSGTVDTTNYSAKEYAQGTQASTGGSAKDYAQKTDGGVSGATSEHSAKAWAVGGTGVTTTSSKGAAKEWATTTGAYVDTAEYSAKEYAIGTTVAAGSAKTHADSASTSAATATTQAGISTTQATASAASASAAATSESNASTSETNAASSASSAASDLATFQGQYHGAAATDPSTGLDDGDLYFNTTNNVMMVYDAGTTTWLRTTPTTTEQGHINTVSGISSDVSTVSGISGNVTTVAGISSDVTSVAGDATDIGVVAGAISPTDNVGTVATNVANVNTTAGSIANVNTTAGSITNVNTVAASIADVNRYANEYTISASAPGSPSQGDLWYDETNTVLKYYNGSTWAALSGDTDVLVGNSASDTTPGYLSAKVAAGNNVTLTTLNSGGNEQLQITASDNSAAMSLALGG